jgi:4-oxalocrotonate tautomerase
LSITRLLSAAGAYITWRRNMPIIRVELFPGRTAEQKRNFAKAVTEGFVSTCGGTPQSVQILFHDVEKENWATAGKLASDAAPASDTKTA